MVMLRFKDELKDLLTDTGPRVISDANLPRLVRQLVVHINVSKRAPNFILHHLVLPQGTSIYPVLLLLLFFFFHLKDSSAFDWLID